MKILVTGGAGFIGSAFIRYWVKKYPKDQIINIDSLTYAGNLENLKEIENRPNYKFFKKDIQDTTAMISLSKNTDLIIHFAAESHVDRSILDDDPFIKTNILGTVSLLKTAIKNKIPKFIHFSTDEVFGSLDLGTKDKFTAESAHKPRSPYSASKAAAEDLVRAYSVTFNIPVIILNCSNNYGPFQFPEKFIPLAITNALMDRSIPIYGDGKNIRDWLYVEDTVEAIETIIKKGKIGETYLVSAGQEKSNIEVAKDILRILSKSERLLQFVKDRPGHDKRYSLDGTKIGKELGWRAKHNFKEGLRLTVDWYRNNKGWWQRVKSGDYKEYYKKQYSKR